MQFRKTKVPTPEQKEEMETKDFIDMILHGTKKFYTDTTLWETVIAVCG